MNGVGRSVVFVVYDSLLNSVFQSQVLDPLMSMINREPALQAYLVSFEGERLSSERLKSIFPAHDRLHLVLCRRVPFLGQASLMLAVKQLAAFLDQKPAHELIARGPFAGNVALRAIKKLEKKYRIDLANTERFQAPRITIQARGLCAEEYRYAKLYKGLPYYKKPLYNFMYKQLNKLEHETFRSKNNSNVSIEVVSPALQDYLIKRFDTKKESIVLAQKDIPKKIHPRQRSLWWHLVRGELGIPYNAQVYCYSGSFKPWQCADKTVEYFAEKHSKNKRSFLLVLSQDQQDFSRECAKYDIPEDNFAVMSVKPQEVYRYLSAADYGMLFRDRDVINWVSRPTKMLEYQAVGLTIVHNDAISLLSSEQGDKLIPQGN
jgi:hypothetical protein